jgi:DNA-binding GntR family transcriptional regulator
MPLTRPETLTTAVATYIKHAIVGGDFPPGSKLPEVALAAELDTSRGTVREALRSLADGGLVQVIPRRGVFVSQLSVMATWEITSLRALLEPYASRLALEAHGTDPAMQAEVREAFEVLRGAVTTADPAAVADADVGFHRAVFQRCGHEMLLNQLDTLQVLSRRIVLTNQLSSADAPTLIAQHEPIVAAVELCDPELLEGAVRTHVIEGGELLMTRMAPLEPHRGRKPDATSFGLGRWPSGTFPHPRRGVGARGPTGTVSREVP